jgi:AraC-like DNA-binding protein
MIVLLQGSGWVQLDASDGPPIRLLAGDHLVATRGAGHRVSRSPSDFTKPVDELLSDSTWQPNTSADATVMLYAQFQLERLMVNPLDIGLPDIVHLNHRRDKELASCLPLLDLVQSTCREATYAWQPTINRLAEIVLMNTLVVKLRGDIQSETASGEHRLMRAITDAVVGPVLKSLADKPEDPWTVPMMAGMANISRSAFSVRFRDLVGLPPLQYLTKIRMQKACHLLREENLEITRIATGVGYESPVSFSSAFKRWTGLSPTEYRRDGGSDVGREN